MVKIEDAEERKQIEEAIKLYKSMTEVERAEIKGYIKCICGMKVYTNENKKICR